MIFRCKDDMLKFKLHYIKLCIFVYFQVNQHGGFHKWRWPQNWWFICLYVYMFMDNSPFTIWRISATPLLFGRPFCRHRMGPERPRLFHIQISHLRVSEVRRRAWLQAFGAGSQHLAGWSQRTLRVKKIRDGEAAAGGAMGHWESGSGGLIMVNNGYSCLIMAYCLVVWNFFIFFPSYLEYIIIPTVTHKVLFFRGVGLKPPIMAYHGCQELSPSHGLEDMSLSWNILRHADLVHSKLCMYSKHQ